jgi:hypothetical protein
MADQDKWSAWELRRGAPVTVGDAKLTPESRTLTLRWPHGGLVWNHPVAVTVQRHGVSERVVIPDVTLVAVLALAGSAALAGLLMILASSRQRRESNEQRN